MTENRSGSADSQRKSNFGVVTPAALILVFGLLSALTPAHGSTSRQFWADRATGLAIAGHDPVAYFTDGRALQGKPAHEYAWRGVTWRFANIGNMAAFKAHPAIYAPQFGGYDALGVARGVTGAGNPRIWIIEKEKLYLFYSLDDKRAWEAEKRTLITRGKRNWPKLMRTLPN